MFTVEVAFPQRVDVVYAYLADPRRRPEWQSSLRRIEALVGEGDVGTTWVDVTAIGPRPRMEVTEAVPGQVWAEVGSWRGVQAGLRLAMVPTSSTTTVRATVSVEARGWRRPIGWAMVLAGPAVVRHDLARAAALLKT